MMIKVGDIVSYNGTQARVMRIESVDDSGQLSAILAATNYSMVAPFDELELVESVTLPEFTLGELVIVHDIPFYEKRKYGCSWVFGSPGMDAIVEACESGQSQSIENIRNHPEEGVVVQIKGLWFQIYHLSSITTYDII